LLTAYSLGSQHLESPDIDMDVTVRGVVSLYGPVDIQAVFANGKKFYESNRSVVDTLEKLYKTFGIMNPESELASPDRMMMNLVGCLPDESPHAYELVSPRYHVGPHCPPTLLIQGAADWLVPAEHVRQLHQSLRKAGVQSVYIELPNTDHGFDLFEPRYSPAAHTALYDIERFLALLV
jgi:acetyl esterase/lipase